MEGERRTATSEKVVREDLKDGGQSQLDEPWPGEKHGEQRQEQVQERGELEEASKWEGEGEQMALEPGGAILDLRCHGKFCKGFGEEQLSYGGWGPHLRSAIHHHLLRPRPC